VNPGRPISYGASAVSGITDKMVRSAPLFKEVAEQLVEALDGAVLVGHNATFDLSFISAELRAAGFDPPGNPVVDTLCLARRCYTFPSNKLGNLAQSLGIRTDGLHRALADATTTWLVLSKFMRDLQSQGVQTLRELIKVQGALTPLSGWYAPTALMEWDGTGPFCPIQGLPPLIEQAVRAQAALKIRYKGSDGEHTERVVEPRKVTLSPSATYLVAFCHLKNEERTFRLDRIVDLRIIESVVG
ncbi:MAG: exonuclease domain-containing protein, partial [Chloroflexota bacterium]|nr:exonuclease domain-containing protein [Chloroflexota bacterium]